MGGKVVGIEAMHSSFRPNFPPPVLRSEFSIELAPAPPSTGSCSLRRSFSCEAFNDETSDLESYKPDVSASQLAQLVRNEASLLTAASFPKKPLATAAPALKRRSSRSSVKFTILKPDGEAGRMTTNGPNGKKGYSLKNECVKPDILNWTSKEFAQAQVRSSSGMFKL